MVESLDFYRRKSEILRTKGMSNDDRIVSALATDSSVEGKFLVDGSGESIKTVMFPIKFIQLPNFTTGGELNLDSSAVAGSYPTMSCIINSWVLDPPQPSDYSKVYFVGAELVVVTTGPTTQRMWIHWRASGKGIVSPDAASAPTTDTVI